MVGRRIADTVAPGAGSSMPTCPAQTVTATPNISPSTPPMKPKTMPSSRKRPTICRRFMPTASMVPISRTRSSTLISIALTMPSSTTRRKMRATMPKMKSPVPISSFMKGKTSSQVWTSYSGPSSALSSALTLGASVSGSTLSAYSVTSPSIRSNCWAVASGTSPTRLSPGEPSP
jgi:hypothetical protein